MLFTLSSIDVLNPFAVNAQQLEIRNPKYFRRKMFPMRLVFLFMGTSMILSNSTFGGESNDRIDSILEFMVNVDKRMNQLVDVVDGLKSEVGKVVETEEQTVMKVVKMEDAMWMIVKKEGEMDGKANW